MSVSASGHNTQTVKSSVRRGEEGAKTSVEGKSEGPTRGNCVSVQSSVYFSDLIMLLLLISWTTSRHFGIYSMRGLPLWLYLFPVMLWCRDAHFKVLWANARKALCLNWSPCASHIPNLCCSLTGQDQTDARWRFRGCEVLHSVRNIISALHLFPLFCFSPILLPCSSVSELQWKYNNFTIKALKQVSKHKAQGPESSRIRPTGLVKECIDLNFLCIFIGFRAFPIVIN